MLTPSEKCPLFGCDFLFIRGSSEQRVYPHGPVCRTHTAQPFKPHIKSCAKREGFACQSSEADTIGKGYLGQFSELTDFKFHQTAAGFPLSGTVANCVIWCPLHETGINAFFFFLSLSVLVFIAGMTTHALKFTLSHTFFSAQFLVSSHHLEEVHIWGEVPP